MSDLYMFPIPFVATKSRRGAGKAIESIPKPVLRLKHVFVLPILIVARGIIPEQLRSQILLEQSPIGAILRECFFCIRWIAAILALSRMKV
jgi:hypothetical protein